MDRLKILLLEDDPGDAFLVRTYLSEAWSGSPLDCRQAVRLSEALELLRSEHFDLALCDLSLPDAHGMDPIVRLRQEAAEVPIVVLTGRDDPEFSVRLIERGVQDYLAKSRLNANDLSRAIRYALERHKLWTQLQSAMRREQLRRQILTRIAEDAPLAETLAELGNALQRESGCHCGMALIPFEDASDWIVWPEHRTGIGQLSRDQLLSCLADGIGGDRQAAGSDAVDQDGVYYFPIRSGSGQLLGQLALQPRGSGDHHVALHIYSELGVAMAALAIQRYRAEESLRRSEEELRQLSGQLMSIQETERKRIAADLHDGIGQSLSVIKLSIEQAAYNLSNGNQKEALEALHQLAPRVKDAIVEIRRISMDLRPSTLDDLGILPTLSWFFREFEAAARGITVEKNINAVEADIPPALKVVIFRILQEAMSNIVKHAEASRIRFAFEKDGQMLIFQVEDNGRGFDAQAFHETPSEGLGLRGMQERARLSGGTYQMKSVRNKGTSIRITWPLPQADALN
ncbi:MAG: response regulator receiver sensor signal transduction histidine kinase [Rhodocyclaceae bacterium]|nr:response regulator receiver sensor signal transduction histidine kinase [Rhodocyclaceae bacterium]